MLGAIGTNRREASNASDMIRVSNLSEPIVRELGRLEKGLRDTIDVHVNVFPASTFERKEHNSDGDFGARLCVASNVDIAEMTSSEKKNDAQLQPMDSLLPFRGHSPSEPGQEPNYVLVGFVKGLPSVLLKIEQLDGSSSASLGIMQVLGNSDLGQIALITAMLLGMFVTSIVDSSVHM